MRGSEVPATPHASLMARLDRLGPAAKEVAQLSAAIGRDFGHELLAAVARQPETELQATIGRLVDAGLVFQRGVPPHATYLFKHVLVRDASYASLLKSRRQQLHASIARILEDRFPEVATAEPERLAHHYTQAALAEPAVNYWRRAGELAISRSAIFEAVAHFGHGLEVLATLPDDRKRQHTEIELRLALAGALTATKGYTALAVLREYERAREVAQQRNDQGSLIRAMFGIWGYHSMQDNQSLAGQAARKLLKAAETHHDVAGRFIGHYCIGQGSFQAGALSTATEHFQKALALDDLEQARIVCHSTAGLDIGANILNYFSRTLAVLGLPHQARSRRDELLVRGRALGHAPSHATSCVGAFITSVLIRDTAGQASAVEKLLCFVAEERFPYYLALSEIYSGWLKIEDGHSELGYFYLSLLANGHLRSGRIDDGLDTLDRAESLIRKSGSRWCEAEVHRLRGDLLLARSTKPEAETTYLKALEIARSQDAKLWEIRAATSLGRLWHDQGKRQEARDLLAPVYGWFMEGFDTPDLMDAKALLEELQ